MLGPDVRFEWDSAKAESNIRKHGISFQLATLVFDDPLAITEQDRIEGGEQRWQTIGMIQGALLLIVAYVDRGHNGFEVIRMISARRAEPKERRRYEQNGYI